MPVDKFMQHYLTYYAFVSLSHKSNVFHILMCPEDMIYMHISKCVSRT